MPSSTWTAPVTFSSGDTLNAAHMNDIGENLKYLKNGDRTRVYQTVAQAIADSTWENVTYDAEDYDTNGLHSTATNTSRLTAVVDGWYLVQFQAVWEISSTGYRDIQIRKNDTSTDGTAGARWGRTTQAGLTGIETIMQCEATLYLSATDFVKSVVKQTSGGALDVETGSWFAMTWLCD